MAHTPSADATVPLASQVGGHPGVRTSEDGSLLIKPALPREVAFYQALMTDPALAQLRPYVPRFYGTLRLEGKVDESAPPDGQLKVVEAGPVADEEKDKWHSHARCTSSLVLENLSHSFLKPNILDIKLGTVLHDDDASDEKRARMEKTARETTSLETGVRLTGFQVYDLASSKAVVTPKSYGKSIAPSDLPDGIARFFPLAPSASKPTAADAPAQGTGTGLPADVLAPLLETLREDVAEIREALAEAELRMVGASLLVVYEADWERARAGLQWLEDGADEDEDEDEEADEEEDSDEEGKKRVGPPYIVKLIDFAHTKLVPGSGPDKGVLKGLDTVLRLLDGRLKQVKAAAAVQDKSGA